MKNAPVLQHPRVCIGFDYVVLVAMDMF
ncbi:hypothetical protein DSUL_60244 [Desulfovibrionales bacterium]